MSSFEQVLETSQITRLITGSLNEAFYGGGGGGGGGGVDRLIAENLIRGSCLLVEHVEEEDSVGKRDRFQDMLLREGVLERITKAFAKLHESEIWKTAGAREMQRYVGEAIYALQDNRGRGPILPFD